MHNGLKLAVFLFPPASLSFPFPLPSSLYVLSEHPLHIKGCYAFFFVLGGSHMVLGWGLCWLIQSAHKCVVRVTW